MTFARLRFGDWLALVAALALLLVMSVDWYSTQASEQARKDAALTKPQGGPVSTETAHAIDDDAKIITSRSEKNAWQADAFADRVILFVLLATAALAIAAAFLRAADARFAHPWSPSAITTLVGCFAVLLLAARIVQKPSADIGAVIKLGAPLGLVCLAGLVIGARSAWREEGEGEPADGAEDTAETAAPAPRERPAPLFDYDDPAVDGGGGTATAVRPVTVEDPAAPPADTPDEPASDWAPDWSDPGTPAAEPEAAPDEDRAARRGRGRGRRGKGKRRRGS